MKLTINTAQFQGMVAKAVKGAGMNSDLFITQLMSISLKDNRLVLETTDSNTEPCLYCFFLYIHT